MYGTIGNVELEVSAKRAMFTEPGSKQTGHLVSYRYPVPGTLSGMLANIYWHPTKENFFWDVKKIRIMNKIKPSDYVQNCFQLYKKDGSSNGNGIVSNTYLKDVRYQIKAQYNTWSGVMNDKNLIIKAEEIFVRRLKSKNPYYPLYLGKQECEATINNTRFGEGEGYYDNSGTMILDEMAFIGFKYPKDGYKNVKTACFAPIKMVDGVITVPSLDEATYTKEITEC